MTKTLLEACRFGTRHSWLIAVGMALTVGTNAVFGDVHLDMLKTRTDSFTNVTVFNRSKTDIFIQHARGMASVKFSELDAETLALLSQSGYCDKMTASTKSSAAASTSASEKAAGAGVAAGMVSTSNLNAQFREKVMPSMNRLLAAVPVRLNSQLVSTIISALLIAYLFGCYCLKLICAKAGSEPGVLIWLPVLQLFPLLRAARMSGWWFVAWLLPVVNLIAQIVWCFKIVQARGKSVWVAIGLLLPITNLFSLLYLAFSGGGGEEPTRKVLMTGPPLLAEA
jgi:hypothetical protein